MAAVKTVVGIDVGGSHVTACAADLDTMKIIPGSERRCTIDPAASPKKILDVLSCIIRENLAQPLSATLHIGVAMPGPFDYEQGISYIQGLGKYEQLYGLNIKAMLAERLGIPATQIRMMNDATAYLLGEICDREDLCRQRVVGITLGTGLGSAWYHNGMMDAAGLYKLPYLDGIAEDYISTRWFLQQYSGQVSGVRELADKYATEPEVRNLFETFGENLARVLLKQFPPGSQDVLIIGGNIARAWHLFIPTMQTVLESNNSTMQVLSAQKGEQAPMLGAAALWKQ